jgi:hypothetical protein
MAAKYFEVRAVSPLWPSFLLWNVVNEMPDAVEGPYLGCIPFRGDLEPTWLRLPVYWFGGQASPSRAGQKPKKFNSGPSASPARLPAEHPLIFTTAFLNRPMAFLISPIYPPLLPTGLQLPGVS